MSGEVPPCLNSANIVTVTFALSSVSLRMILCRAGSLATSPNQQLIIDTDNATPAKIHKIQIFMHKNKINTVEIHPETLILDFSVSISIHKIHHTDSIKTI